MLHSSIISKILKVERGCYRSYKNPAGLLASSLLRRPLEPEGFSSRRGRRPKHLLFQCMDPKGLIGLWLLKLVLGFKTG